MTLTISAPPLPARAEVLSHDINTITPGFDWGDDAGLLKELCNVVGLPFVAYAAHAKIEGAEAEAYIKANTTHQILTLAQAHQWTPANALQARFLNYFLQAMVLFWMAQNGLSGAPSSQDLQTLLSQPS